MSKLQKYREESMILRKRLSKRLAKREANAMISGDEVMAETLAAEAREILDLVLSVQDALPSAMEDPSMMTEVFDLLVGKPMPKTVEDLKNARARGPRLCE